MSSKAIFESSAKYILYSALSVENLSKNPVISISPENRKSLDLTAEPYSKWVAKPDVLIKRRGKLNLVHRSTSVDDLLKWLDDRLGAKLTIGSTTGVLNRFVIEPFVPHEQHEEYYVCVYTKRESNVILFHHAGGVDVGTVDDVAHRYEVLISDMMNRQASGEPILSAAQLLESSLLSEVTDLPRRCLLAKFLVDLHRVFDELHFTYLEINPLVICPWSGPNCTSGEDLHIHILDAAAKLDQCAEYLFVNNNRWSQSGALEFPCAFGRTNTPEEAFIAELDARTGASMKLSILNPNGRIWTMNAGGGASVIYADTVCALAERVKLTGGGGLGAADLANYGEYSGAPSEGQTYEYAKTILTLMTRGEPHPEGKVLIIGGGIANFTNVATTFRGIIGALKEYQSELKRHRVQIYVRRAGPNFQEGLRIMRELGSSLEIPIHVYGPETHMTAIVSMAFNLREVTSAAANHYTPIDSILMATSMNSASPEHTQPVLNGCTEEQLPYGSDIFHRDTTCIVWGLQTKAVQSMLDFDYVSHRETPSVAGVVYPFADARQVKAYWGPKEILLPVYKDMSSAVVKHPDTHVLVNFASLRVAFDVTMEAMMFNQNKPAVNGECRALPSRPQFTCIAIIAEGIPENFTRRLISRAQKRNVLIIGPATVGGVKPGYFKIGNTGGMVDNIISARLYRPGSVAYVSRSGGMSNELNNIISLNSDGVEEGVAIGGDRYPGSTFLDHILRYEANPNVGMIVMLGEVGGTEEYAVAEAVLSGRIRKPIVAWCIGTCAQLLSQSSGSIQFGHAGACANSEMETATAKNAALAAAGLHVPTSFDELDLLIRKVFDGLVATSQWVSKPDRHPRPVPLDYSWAKELGLIRRPAAFTSTICDDRGAELRFAGVPITQVISENFGIGGVLGLLWFKRRLPPYACKFLELCLIITADHGPAVSGALNTIVTARAGKDLLSSLTSGLLTIGDRFGGALDAAARQFSAAFDSGLRPAEFVANERRASRLIMGIGHRVKSITNPDMRVRLLSDFAHEHFPKTPLVDYGFAVEKITTTKRPNLILNVDGMIGVAMVDLLRYCGHFTREEADEYISIGTLNGLFVLGRSIGFIGHYLDQKRLHQGLYRHPWEDISYLVPDGEAI